jgi:CheY-like chemotaxis protein
VNVITAGSVAEALEALSPCPDIVLTDYLMPGVVARIGSPHADRFVL